MVAVEQAEDICWVWSNYLRMPLAAWRFTMDRKYLDGFVTAMDALLTRLRKAPDGFLGFRGLPYPLFRDPATPDAQCDVNIAEFTVAHLMCDFAEIVAADDTLKRAYQDKAARYLDIAETHLVGKKWEARGEYKDLGLGGAVHLMATECGNNRKNLTDPHNKQAKICSACFALYRVTGNDTYFRKAVKLGVRFKRTLRLEGPRYLWHYWDPAGEWDRKPGTGEWKHWIGPEHRSGYHGLTVGMAAELYDYGVVFDRDDMERFGRTQTEVCWNGSIDAPIFRNTGGGEIPEKDRSVMVAPALARFVPKGWEFCYGERATKERLADREDPWLGGPAALGYLCGKYFGPRSPEPARTEWRERFLANPGNAEFLMGFRIVPTGERGAS
jgi:hypothetical protein